MTKPKTFVGNSYDRPYIQEPIDDWCTEPLRKKIWILLRSPIWRATERQIDNHLRRALHILVPGVIDLTITDPIMDDQLTEWMRMEELFLQLLRSR